MGSFLIEGGKRLYGSVKVSGSKNAALPVLCAALLVKGTCVIENCPQITDVFDTCRMLEQFGCRLKWEGHTLYVNAKSVHSAALNNTNAGKIRSSVLFMGAELGRFHNAKINKPGGCLIGERPIDMHIEGLESLGAEIREDEGLYICRCENPRGAHIRLKMPSVGATENIIILSVKADGETIIDNAAKEPEVCALCDFLNLCGAEISGTGTEKLIINGVKKLHGCRFRVIDDRIEAGTFLCAVAGCGGDVFVNGNIAPMLTALIKKLDECGCCVSGCSCGVRLISRGIIMPVDVETTVYPGFPTDLQPQIMSVLTKGSGLSTITENVFEKRLGHTKELIKLGAKIEVKRNTAFVEGVKSLKGASLTACDLRAGAGLITGALMSEGNSEVFGSQFIKRGYEDIDRKLRSIGASIVYKDTGDTNG